AGFQVDQKSASDAGRQRKLILTHLQRFAPAADERAEGQSRFRGAAVDRAFVIVHVPSLAMFPNGNFASERSRFDENVPAGELLVQRCNLNTGFADSAPLRRSFGQAL